jgi:hypothetical protein
MPDLALHVLQCLGGPHLSMGRAGGRRKDRARAKYELQHIARTLTTDQKVSFQGAGRGSVRPPHKQLAAERQPSVSSCSAAHLSPGRMHTGQAEAGAERKRHAVRRNARA